MDENTEKVKSTSSCRKVGISVIGRTRFVHFRMEMFLNQMTGLICACHFFIINIVLDNIDRKTIIEDSKSKFLFTSYL